jgi:membrane protein
MRAAVGFCHHVLHLVGGVISHGSADLVVQWMEPYWPAYHMSLFQIANGLISLSIISVLFALMFKILPDAKIKWRYVWVGAFLTGFIV